MDSEGLKGKRILLVEDSPVVANFAEDMLKEVGCLVVGPAPNMAVARTLSEQEAIDAAVVDIHIRGEKAFAICDILQARGVPFVLTSGYANWPVPEKWQDTPRLAKPYKLADLERAVSELLSGSGG